MKKYKNGQFHKKELFLDEKIFILKNYDTMKYDDILNHLNSNRNKNNQIAYSTLRHRFKDLKCFKYTYIPWAKIHEKYLKSHYKTMGNTEIASHLSSKMFRSKKVFTRFQIEKKMSLLDIHRTLEERSFIIQRNFQIGIGKSEIPKYTRQRILINKFNKNE